jgi:hypothetical protein
VETLHQWVQSALIVSIENDNSWSAGRYSQMPANGHRLTVGTLDTPAHRFASFVIGLEEVGCRDDAELLALLSTTEEWRAGHRLGAGIVGLAGQLQVGPVGHHAKHGGGNFQFARRLVRAAQDGRHIAWPCLWRKDMRRSNTGAMFHLLFAAQGEVSAHKLFNEKNIKLIIYLNQGKKCNVTPVAITVITVTNTVFKIFSLIQEKNPMRLSSIKFTLFPIAVTSSTFSILAKSLPVVSLSVKFIFLPFLMSNIVTIFHLLIS